MSSSYNAVVIASAVVNWTRVHAMMKTVFGATGREALNPELGDVNKKDIFLYTQYLVTF